MSFASYFTNIDGVRTFYQPQIYLENPPNSNGFAIRGYDVMDEVGNATYPLSYTQVVEASINPMDTILFSQPASSNGAYTEADFLHIAPLTTKSLGDSLRLLDLTYSVKIAGNSLTGFVMKVVYTDVSLNIQGTSSSFTWNTTSGQDPPTISAVQVKGFSIEVPENAVYAFIMITPLGTTGSISIKPYLIHSELKMATTNNTLPSLVGQESTSHKNQYFWETTTTFTDSSGVQAEISNLESQVSSLQQTTLSTTTQNSQALQGTLAIQGLGKSLKVDTDKGIVSTNVGQYITNNSTYPIIQSSNGAGVYGLKGSSNNEDFVMLKSLGNDDTSANAMLDNEGMFSTETLMSKQGTLYLGDNNTKRLGLFGYNQNGNTYLECGDASTNQVLAITSYFSSDITAQFNCNPTSSSLDMKTHPIINVANPTNAQDVATKAYVDSHSGGSTTTLGYVGGLYIPNFNTTIQASGDPPHYSPANIHLKSGAYYRVNVDLTINFSTGVYNQVIALRGLRMYYGLKGSSSQGTTTGLIKTTQLTDFVSDVGGESYKYPSTYTTNFSWLFKCPTTDTYTFAYNWGTGDSGWEEVWGDFVNNQYSLGITFIRVG